jgi:Lrp/AsnC family transcriptional regulator, leucine-responsive regulatory protein
VEHDGVIDGYLPSVADVRSNFAIRTVKAPGPLPLGHLA